MTTAQCPTCGQFYGPSSAKRHRVCFMIEAEKESGYHPLYGVVQGAAVRAKPSA